MTKINRTGRTSLKKSIQDDIDSKRTFQTDQELWKKYDQILGRAEHYAKKTGLDTDEILNAWEKQRTYWYMNYYQEANQPKIEGDNVQVFETVENLMESVGNKGFRCPSCEQISTNPYSCNSGHVEKNEKCNWKVNGLFGDLGKGVHVFVKDKMIVENIFFPIAWEKEKRKDAIND